MFLCYFDESGDAGIVNSPTDWFVLACVIVHESHWLETLDKLIALRRDLKANAGIPTKIELKAQHLNRGVGALRHLTKSQRHQIFADITSIQTNWPIHNFAVAIDKRKSGPKGYDARMDAWTFALERIHTFVSKAGSGQHMVIFPDEGHGSFIRKLLRKMRRHHYVGGFYGDTLKASVTRIIEDPNDRDSRHSYFVQVADWNAYAAHRSIHIDPRPTTPNTLWDNLGSTLVLDVNRLRQRLKPAPPGIVVRPT